MHRGRFARAIAYVTLSCLCVTSARAWHDEGHYYTALAAVGALPNDMPEFFRQGAATVAHLSLDPDVAKHPGAPQLRRSEEPEHYLDLEFLQGAPLPPTRDKFRALCAKMGLDTHDVGMLPYAITEWTERLTLAFAEHRKWPENPHIHIKCIVYAGILSHYAADLTMPLHTSVHWDGRVPVTVSSDGDKAFGPSPRTGIHLKVDALPTRLPYAQIFGELLESPPAYQDIFAFVTERIASTHKLVDRVYELEPQMGKIGQNELSDPELIAFTIERTRAAAKLTATILHSAWQNSATLELPFWLDRATFDERFDPTRIPPQPARPE